MESGVRKVVFFNLLIFFVGFLSTPGIQYMGLAGNIDAICVGLLLVGLSQIVLSCAGKIGPVLVAMGLALVIVLNFASWLYVEQQQVYLSIHTLYLVSEVTSLLQALELTRLLFGLACLAAAAVVLAVVANNARFESRKFSISLGSLLVLSLVGIQMMYVSVTEEEKFDTTDTTPLGYLIRSTGVMPFVKIDIERVFDRERRTIVKNMVAGRSRSFPSKYSAENIYSLLGREADFDSVDVDPMYPINKVSAADGSRDRSVTAENKSNVIIVVLESVRASEMGLYGAAESATPFLDSLARDNIFSSKFYTTSNFTVKSEHAIHCSTYDFMIGAPVSKREMPVRTRCLPEILQKEHGYSTVWFHGNDKDFYNRGRYLPKIGFQEIYSKDELNNESQIPELGWGIPDPDLFALALEKLEAIDGPFYSEILTVSNHMPFDYDWSIDFPEYLSADSTMFERYRRGIYYTDQAVKSFYQSFKESSLSEDTILIVTGDHGVWTFSEDTEDELLKNEQFFRVPFVMALPDGRNETLDGIHSHLDISPTVLDLLGVGTDNAFVGEAMLAGNPNRSERVLYLMTEQALSYRFKNKACIPTIQCQNNLNCYKTYEAEPAATQCYAIDDSQDLLVLTNDQYSSADNVTPEERVLFDYSQMALELGTGPQFSPIESIVAATLDE